MANITQADLRNPRGVVAIMVYRLSELAQPPTIVTAGPDQAFQECRGSWELWQFDDQGEALPQRVQRWLKRSVPEAYKLVDDTLVPVTP